MGNIFNITMRSISVLAEIHTFRCGFRQHISGHHNLFRFWTYQSLVTRDIDMLKCLTIRDIILNSSIKLDTAELDKFK
jgi:hypothetical protein